MIEFLHKWIEQIAVAVILASIFEMILPKGKTQKYIKMILGVFIIFNIISPFVNGSNLYNFNVNSIIENNMNEIEIQDTQKNTSVDNKIEEIYIRELEQDISNTIEEQGYIVKKCKIKAVLYSDKEDAGINAINITISSKNNNNLETSNTYNIDEVNEIDIEVNLNNSTIEENTNYSITEKDIKKLKKYISEYYQVDKKIININ